MLSKSELKVLRSLQHKKYRREHHMFIVEGIKSVEEVVGSDFVIKDIYATAAWIESDKNQIERTIRQVSLKECEQISSLQTTPKVFALVEMKENRLEPLSPKCLLLDDIKDAGNLGTLIRTADWFGIHSVICSLQCVEMYNPKCIQASMGSFTRVNVYYTDLIASIKQLPEKYKVYGTFLEGKDLRKVQFHPYSALVIGNESNGISKEVAAYIQERICIERQSTHAVDSLNVAAATAIVCYALSC
ncbi:MAG: RNA methyltransferase [Bacteroidales bacterium]|nr:RNA methyltransferase [Bacteroidales bacterium]